MDLAPDLVALARERFALRDYHGAIVHLRDAMSRGRRYADAYNLLGLALAMIDLPSDALVAFDQALAINPRYREAHLNRALVLGGLGRTEDAQAAFTEAAALAGPDATGLPAAAADRLANAHAELGHAYRDAGALDRAVEQYGRALELRPSYADVRLALARALVDGGRAAEGALVLDTLLGERPEFFDAMLLRGLAAYLLGDLEGADQVWSRAAGVQGKDPRLHIYRSMLARRPARG